MRGRSEAAPIFSSRSYGDFDSFRELLRGWDTEPFQLSTGSLRLDYDLLEADGLAVSRLRTNCRIADTSAVEAGRKTFVVTLAPKHWCGIEVPSGSLVVMGAGREYRAVLAPRWESIEFTVSDALLREVALPWADASVEDLAPERCVFPLPQAALARLKAWVDSLCEATRATSHDRGPWPPPRKWVRRKAEALEYALSALLPPLLTSAEGPLPPQPRGRAAFELAREAIGLYEASQPRRPTIADLAGALGVSRRTLELAFRHALGCSPYQYFLARRLGSSRSQLLAGIRVTDAAVAQDFFNPGRFSDQYRRLFGELPSHTRLRAPGRRLAAEGEPSRTETVAPGPG